MSRWQTAGRKSRRLGRDSERKVCWRVTRRCSLGCEHCLAGFKNIERDDLDVASLCDILGNLSSCFDFEDATPGLRGDVRAVPVANVATTIGE